MCRATESSKESIVQAKFRILVDQERAILDLTNNVVFIHRLVLQKEMKGGEVQSLPGQTTIGLVTTVLVNQPANLYIDKITGVDVHPN